MAQRSLRGLSNAPDAALFNDKDNTELSVIAEQAKRRAEVARYLRSSVLLLNPKMHMS